MNIQRGAVVIPAYGKVDLTRATVGDCLREPDVVSVIVVDNGGDFELDDARVTVMRPGSNLGWLRGTNYGLKAARASGHDWLVGLNNDTRLSAGFFDGLRRALAAHPDGLIAPCYDDHTATQTGYFAGPVEEFPAEPVEEQVQIIDGTCFSMTAELLDRLGPMDARHFGRRGWGGIEDYILRARGLGGGAYVTRRAYLTHARGSTARAVMPSYHRYAIAEMRRGLRRIHGAHWRREFALPVQTPDSTGTRLRDLLRSIEDRLGLSETAIGRR